MDQNKEVHNQLHIGPDIFLLFGRVKINTPRRIRLKWSTVGGQFCKATKLRLRRHALKQANLSSIYIR